MSDGVDGLTAFFLVLFFGVIAYFAFLTPHPQPAQPGQARPVAQCNIIIKHILCDQVDHLIAGVDNPYSIAAQR